MYKDLNKSDIRTLKYLNILGFKKVKSVYKKGNFTVKRFWSSDFRWYMWSLKERFDDGGWILWYTVNDGICVIRDLISAFKSERESKC